MSGLRVSELFEANRAAWHLRPLTGAQGFDRVVTSDEVSRPGLFLSGFEAHFPEDRVQVFGKNELEYLRTLAPEVRQQRLERLFQRPVPVVFVTHGDTPPEPFLELASRFGVPVFVTPMHTTDFIRRLSNYLSWELAPSMTLHGTLVDVYGVGILMTGPSGIGKSECALDLVARGHVLVADDLVLLKHYPPGELQGMSAAQDPRMRHYIEIRGIGLLDIHTMFGIRAIRDRKRVEIHVELYLWDKATKPERLGLERETSMFLDVEIPHIRLPLNPGKNIGVILEALALDFNLKRRGVHMARTFQEVLKQHLNPLNPDEDPETQ